MSKVVKLLAVFDLGNSRTKYKIKDLKSGYVEKSKQFSTFTTSSRPFDYDKNYDEAFKNLDQHIEFSVISPTLPPRVYLIGDGAVNSGHICDYMLTGENKVTSEIPYAMALGLLAKFVAKQYPKENVKVKIDLAISLPIGQISDEMARKYEDNFMKEAHIVELVIGDVKQRIELEFEYVRTLPEGAVSIFGLIYNEDGKIRKDSPFIPSLKKMYEDAGKDFSSTDEKTLSSFMMRFRALHLDIGDGTTELPVTEGIKYLKEFASGENAGAGYVLQNARKKFIDSIHVPDAPRQYLSTVIEDPFHKHHGRAMKLVQKYMVDQIKKIKGLVISQLQKTRNELHAVVVHGGGSCLFQDPLESQLKEELDKREIPLIYMNCEEAIWANVEGLYQFINSPIYKQLKEKHKQQVV